MNAAHPMTRRLDVAEFVDQVKAHLADLSPEDREDLIDGLEADLTERLEESGVTRRRSASSGRLSTTQLNCDPPPDWHPPPRGEWRADPTGDEGGTTR